jgi:hypothetical protein
MIWIHRILTALLIACAPVNFAAASAEGVSSQIYGSPLVTIRFNKPVVDYQRQLYQAISRAVQIKPEVMIDLVTKGSASSGSDPSALRAREVAAVLNSMGVPSSRITMNHQQMSGADYPEVRVYVR